MTDRKFGLGTRTSIRGEVIGLRAITKSFPAPRGALGLRRAGSGRLEVLKDISLQVYTGEIMGIVGSNGAGKTTLLEILATTQLPTSGDGSVGGYDLIAQSESVKRAIGYCAANPESFYPRLTGRANLEFFGALKDLSPSEARCRAQCVLELIGAPELADTVFQRCSTGMKQKLSLARALLSDPPILLLDEPTRSLDPSSQREFQSLLREKLAGALGKTVLLVTHNLEEAKRICDRAALIQNGTIAAIWPAASLPSELVPGTFSDGGMSSRLAKEA